MSAQTISTHMGEASVRMIVPGVRKIPTAITWPTTSATADRTVSSRASAACTVHQNVARTANWKGARPSGPERPAGGRDGAPEL